MKLRGGQFELVIMWEIASESIQKQYNAQILSRSFLLSAACCIFSFVIPILILVSIGYSWSSYKQVLIQPELTFDQYQCSCLLSDDTILYDSSFVNEITPNSHKCFVGAATQSGRVTIWANALPNALPTNVVACSFLVYFRVAMGSTLTQLATLPVNFQQDSTAAIVAVRQWGSLTPRLLSPIPQSAVTHSSNINYHLNNSQQLGLTDSHRSFALANNLSLVATRKGRQVEIGTNTAAGVTYTGEFNVGGVTWISETSLLDNLRSFVPFFIYLFVLFWVFLAQPTVRWMLQNKIYRAKVTHPKLKHH